MTPTAFIDLGMVLAWNGFDVDTIPYGQAVTASDLEGAAMVVALPVHDYPTADGDLTVYDEAWTASEIDVLDEYVSDGGFLVLTNSAHRLKYHNQVWDPNEDWSDVNALAGRFGVAYSNTTIDGTTCPTWGTHPLVAGVQELTIIDGNGIPFTHPGWATLARCGTRAGRGPRRPRRRRGPGAGRPRHLRHRLLRAEPPVLEQHGELREIAVKRRAELPRRSRGSARQVAWR